MGNNDKVFDACLGLIGVKIEVQDHASSSSLPSVFCPCTTMRMNSLSGATRISYLVVLRRINFS